MATNSIYRLNKGINRSIEFRGLKSQYIWYLGGGLIALLILFSMMYLIGLPSYLCVAVIISGGSFLVIKVYAMSNKYGEHGLMKAIAYRRLPGVVKCRSRQIFITLNNQHHEKHA